MEVAKFDFNGQLLKVIDEAARESIVKNEKELEETNRNIRNTIKQTTDSTLNSYAGGLAVNRIVGAVEQKQYTGKNLIPYPYNETSHTQSGITFTDNGDGTVTANGTSTDYAIYYFNGESTGILLPVGTYTLSGCFAGGGGTKYKLQVMKDTTQIALDSGTGTTFEITEPTSVIVRIMIYGNHTLTNAVFKPMLQLGSTATEWEPYVGGTFSPNPEYPQGIENVEIGEIKTHNKNIIPYPFPYYGEGDKTLNGVTFTSTKGYVIINGEPTINTFSYRLIGASKPMKLPAGTYTISGHSGDDTRYHVRVYSVKNGDTTPIATDRGSGATFTLKTETDISVSINTTSDAIGNPFSNVVVKPQLELGNKATEWEAYKDTTASFAFTGRAVEVDATTPYTYEKDGKYYIADTIERVDDGYRKVQRVRRFIFDGTERWGRGINADGINYRMYFNNSDVPSYKDLGVSTWSKVLMCSHMQQCLLSSTQPYTSGETIALHNSNHTIQLYAAKHQNVDSWKAFLAEQYANGTPFTVDVIMAEPIVTTLSDEKVIALLSLKSFDEVTHIKTDSTVKPVIDVEYGTSDASGVAIEAFNNSEQQKIITSGIDNRVGKLDKRAEDFEESTNEAIVSINQSLDGLNEYMESLSEAVNGLNEFADNANSQFETMQSDIGTIQRNINNAADKFSWKLDRNLKGPVLYEMRTPVSGGNNPFANPTEYVVRVKLGEQYGKLILMCAELGDGQFKHAVVTENGVAVFEVVGAQQIVLISAKVGEQDVIVDTEWSVYYR